MVYLYNYYIINGQHYSAGGTMQVVQALWTVYIIMQTVSQCNFGFAINILIMYNVMHVDCRALLS